MAEAIPTSEEFIAPAGGVIAGQAYLLSLASQITTTREALVVASATVGAGVRFTGLTGTVEYAKPHEEAWTAGDAVYWHAGGGCMTTTPQSSAGGQLRKVGVADQDAVIPSTTGFVRLDALPGGGGGGGALPTVTSVAPSTAVCGGPDLTLHVHGTGFSASSVVVFNGGEELTTFVSSSELTTLVKPSLATSAVVVAVSVVGATTAVDFTFTPGAPAAAAAANKAPARS